MALAIWFAVGGVLVGSAATLAVVAAAGHVIASFEGTPLRASIEASHPNLYAACVLVWSHRARKVVAQHRARAKAERRAAREQRREQAAALRAQRRQARVYSRQYAPRDLGQMLGRNASISTGGAGLGTTVTCNETWLITYAQQQNALANQYAAAHGAHGILLDSLGGLTLSR
jgi:hypothetical protein